MQQSKKLDEYEEVALYHHPRRATFMAVRQRTDTRLFNLGGRVSKGGLVKMHRGMMSPHAKQKLRTAVEWLNSSAKEKYLYSKITNRYHKWKLNFITLTLPTQGKTTDIQVKAILNSWLTFARYAYGLRSYVWKAEPQMNGNIHFHVTSDCFIWKTSLQLSWNRILRKNNLLNGHENPPSTKVHSTYRVRNMSAYLCKYMSKQTKYQLIRTGHVKDWYIKAWSKQKKLWRTIPYVKSKCERIIIGRLWGCSHTLSGIKPFKLTMEKARATKIHEFYRQESFRCYENEYVCTYQIPPDYYQRIDDTEIRDWYNKICSSVRKKKYTHQFELYNSEGGIVTDKNIIRRFVETTNKK